MSNKKNELPVQLRQTAQELKCIDATMREVRARLAAIVASSNDAIIAIDLDGIITDWNMAAEKIFGYRSSEVIGRPVSALAPAGHGDDLRLVLERVKRGEHVESFETSKMRNDGSMIDLSLTVSPIFDEKRCMVGASAIGRDITEQKRMELRLRENEERFRLLVEWAPDAVIVHREPSILYVNCSALGIYGVTTREQMQESDFLALVHPDDLDLVRLQLKQIQVGEKMSLHEFRLLKPNGASVPVEAAGIMVDYEGSPAYLSILRDLTERKHVEKERLWAVEELRAHEHLLIKKGCFVAIGDMINNIAHEWRQPLNILALLVQELPVYNNHDQLTKEQLNSTVTKAMQVISRLSQTIDGFRQYLPPDPVKTTFNVREVLENTVAMVYAAYSAPKMKFEIVAEEDISVFGYPCEFSEVILSILINARDAALERQIPHPMVEVMARADDGKVVVNITDNAGGIPEEIVDRIFEPYFSSKTPGKKTGMGLFMARNVIERQMGGTVSVRNVAQGAQFQIEVQ
jgi:PAS domain S-box-containing protein